jgi:hypothetical protein
MLPKHTRNSNLESSLSTFQLTEKDLNAAYAGDPATLKHLGLLAQKGRAASEIAPKVAAHLADIIAGTVAIEQAHADIITKSSTGDITVKKAVAATTLAGDKYANTLKEHAAKFAADADLEKNRHNHAFSHAAILAAIASNTQKVEHQFQTTEMAQKLQQKQAEYDYAHNQKQAAEYLERGAYARELPKKDFLSGLKGIGKSLGF